MVYFGSNKSQSIIKISIIVTDLTSILENWMVLEWAVGSRVKECCKYPGTCGGETVRIRLVVTGL